MLCTQKMSRVRLNASDSFEKKNAHNKPVPVPQQGVLPAGQRIAAQGGSAPNFNNVVSQLLQQNQLLRRRR